MKQVWLPGFEGPEREDPAGVAPDLSEEPVEAEMGPVPVLPGQIALFTVERELLGLLESAIGDGRFEDARRVRDELVAREGPTRETRRLHVLDSLTAPGFWARPVDQCVDAWLEIERRWDDGEPAVRAMVRDGVTLRLLSIHGAWAVVRARPLVLATVVNFLGKPGVEREADAAADLLRDALAAGIGAASGDFHDPAFVDLLAEDRAPQWLACLGALRRLWPVPPVPAQDLDLPLPIVPEDDEERGSQFWQCLQLATSSPRDSPASAEARKRMKVLDAALHAQFMRQGVGRE
ncbi:MAG: hypothetical protein EHM24_06615 [Acidobacteria bacterium]|nr:MAG: hypothetical protein EHM24_06615 [Acidobacteriota bacterium]